MLTCTSVHVNCRRLPAGPSGERPNRVASYQILRTCCDEGAGPVTILLLGATSHSHRFEAVRHGAISRGAPDLYRVGCRSSAAATGMSRVRIWLPSLPDRMLANRCGDTVPNADKRSAARHPAGGLANAVGRGRGEGLGDATVYCMRRRMAIRYTGSRIGSGHIPAVVAAAL